MPIARSLRARVLIWVGLALTVLFALTVYGLDRTFRAATDRSREELLDAQLFGLIALTETDASGRLSLPHDAINPRFGLADSGLYAALWDGAGVAVWQSQSLTGRAFPQVEPPPPGVERFVRLEAQALPPVEALVMQVNWELPDGSIKPHTFAVAASLEPYEAQQRAFRRNVISWFIGVTVTMLIVILGVLGWVLRPVRRLARQVRAVENGDRTRLTGEYPTELVGLASNLNALIETERSRLERYRHTLDDLAHSLKTPLAALRALLSGKDDSQSARDVDRELTRMEQLVSYQLRRARASGATGLGAEPVAVDNLVADLVFTLDKVYRDKGVRCETDVPPGTHFLGDPCDLMEILGNLMDNAYKYGRQRVRVAAHSEGRRLVVTVDDDGPGMSHTAFAKLLERGTRADESVPGQGIGLAVVSQTAALYDGAVTVEPSPLGGASVRVELGRAGVLGP
jgi:two-component system, OmpR family, sensor histidine kinase PhoQ